MDTRELEERNAYLQRDLDEARAEVKRVYSEMESQRQQAQETLLSSAWKLAHYHAGVEEAMAVFSLLATRVPLPDPALVYTVTNFIEKYAASVTDSHSA